MRQKEIEKKFLLKKFPPNLSTYPKVQIEQGYLITSGTPTLRIRKKNDEYILGYKLRKTEEQTTASVCQEVELPLTLGAYEQLKPKIDGRMIEKERYQIPLANDLMAELDVFHGFLEGFQCVEVEFPSEEEAKNFQPPEWFGKEVTFDTRFKNAHLCKLVDSAEIRNLGKQ